jgi:hypothetical protein
LVEDKGFETVTMDDIIVTADECHVIPASMMIEMDPM